MADKTLTIKILGDSSGFQSSLAKIAPALSGIAAAATLFGKQAIDAFAEAQQSTAQLEAVLKSTGGVAGVTKESVLQLAAALQQQTGVSDEAAVGAQSMLLTFTNIGQKIFPDTTRAVLDMATAMNGGAIPSAEQLRSTAIQVGKALQDPIEGVTALQRVGVRLTDTQKDLVKSLVATGQTAEAQTVILKELQKEFGGSADAAGKTFAGQLKIAREGVSDFNEAAGETIVSVLQPMVEKFPGVMQAVLGTSDAIGTLNITSGDLLIAGPRLLDMLGGWAGALTRLGQAASVAAAAFAGWEIGRFIGGLEVGGQSIDKWTEKLFTLTTYSIQNATALKENEVAINRIAGVLKTPIVRQAGEDWKHYSERVLEAAKSEAQASTAHVQTATNITKVTTAAKSHVLTLSQQIAEQKKLVESLKNQEGKSKELTEAVAKLEGMQQKQSAATSKSTAEIKSWGSALGVTIPKLKETVVEGEKYVAYLKRSGASAAEVREAEQRLGEARIALTRATSPLIIETERLLQATKDLDRAEIANLSTLNAAQRQARETTDTLHDLGLVAGRELPAEFGKPTTAVLDLNASFKTLGVTSTAALQNTAREATAAFESIRSSGTASARDVELAWVAMTEAQIEAGEQVSSEAIRAVDVIRARYGSLKDDGDANLSTWRELASKQVSTLVSDVSKGFADIIVSAGSFGDKMISIFKNIGTGILQGFFESGIGGLLSGKGFGGFGGFIGGLIDSVKGIFGGGKTGTAGSLAGIVPGLLGGGGGTAGTIGSLGGVLGGALGIGGIGSLATGGLATSAAGLGGVLPGSIMAGFGGGLGGTAGGTAAAGTAASGGLMSSLGALATNPITIAAAAAIGGTLLVRRLTRRGREKEDATGQAEQMSQDVWQGIVPEVEAGRATIDEGIAAIQQRFADYEAWLRANLKDQTVITRSIETQRITLTEGIAALENLRGKQEEVAGKRAELERLVDEFTKTGIVSGALSDMVEELGGNLEKFREFGEISELAGLQTTFSDLRAELEKMGPPVEDLYGNFLQTGEVTDALRAKITEFGGSAAVFEQFAGLRTMRSDFEALSASILTTGEGLDQIRPIFERMGASVEALDMAAALPGLQGLRGEFASLAAEIQKLLPATLSWQEQFLKTGVITDEMREKIAQAGGDLSVFNKAAGEIQAGGLSESTANVVATELGKMTKGLDEQIAELQAGLESALEDVGNRLDVAFEDSRQALIAQLETLDSSLDTTIGNLQTALAAEVANLSAAISGIQIPDQITVNVEGASQPAAPVYQEAPDQGQGAVPDYAGSAEVAGSAAPDIYNTYNPYLGTPYNPYNLYPYGGMQFGGAFAMGGSGVVRKPTLFLAGEAGPERFEFTPLAGTSVDTPEEKRQRQTAAAVNSYLVSQVETLANGLNIQTVAGRALVVEQAIAQAQPAGSGTAISAFARGEMGDVSLRKSEALQQASELVLMPAIMDRVQASFARVPELARGPDVTDNSKQVSQTLNMPVHFHGVGNDPFAFRREADRLAADILNKLNV